MAKKLKPLMSEANQAIFQAEKNMYFNLLNIIPIQSILTIFHLP